MGEYVRVSLRRVLRSKKNWSLGKICLGVYSRGIGSVYSRGIGFVGGGGGWLM